MSESISRRVRDLFDRALSLSADERGAFLERECGDEPELRRRVETLLDLDPRTDELAVPASPFASPAPEEDSAFPGISGYTILRRIGAGGMGVVYEAEQQEPRRRVAIKLLRGGAFADELRVKLFEREIRTLARLDHPGIATIHASGRATDGQLFYAMELVDGTPLDEHFRRAVGEGGPAADRRGAPAGHRGAAAGDALRENLRLFLRVCAAVSYAHRRGIIHRDLKPSNILVTPPEPGDSSATEAGLPGVKILDFGLARAVDAEGTLVTDLGVIRGTLQYMSPEQAGGNPAEVDVRSDVYALGVMLYRMLTGRMPYDVRRDSVVEALRVIREETPAAARKIAPRLDPDLEVIAGKALAKHADERYGSVTALAEDVSRYLSSLPILARPPSTLYQFRKLVARHRVPFALAGVLLASLVGFAVWMSVLYARADANLRRALAAERESARQAETSSRVSDFLIDLFEVSDPVDGAGGGVSAREILDAGAERIARDLDEQPEIRASLQATMAQTYLNLGAYAPADTLIGGALASWRDLRGEESAEAAEALRVLAWIRNEQGRFEEGEELAREAAGIQERVLGPASPELAETLDVLAALCWHQGRHAAAESMVVRTMEIHEEAFGPDDPSVAHAANSLGNIYLAQNRLEEAEAVLRRSVDIRQRVLGPDHANVGSTMNNLAEVYRRQERHAEAESLYVRSLEIQEKALGPDHPGLAYGWNNLGLLYQKMDRPGDAERVLRRALSIREAALPREHPLIAWTLDNLAQLLVSEGRTAEAEPLLRRALSIAEEATGGESLDWAIVSNNLAKLREAQGRWKDAEARRRRVVEIYSDTLGPDDLRLAQRLSELADNLAHQKSYDEAVEIRRRILAMVEQARGPEHESAGRARGELAGLLREAGSEGEAAGVEAAPGATTGDPAAAAGEAGG